MIQEKSIDSLKTFLSSAKENFCTFVDSVDLDACKKAAELIVAGDVVIAISNSGETVELKATVNAIHNNGCKVIAVTGNPDSWLSRNPDCDRCP